MKWRTSYNEKTGVTIYSGKKKNHFIEIVKENGLDEYKLNVIGISGAHKTETCPTLEIAMQNGEHYATKGLYRKLI